MNNTDTCLHVQRHGKEKKDNSDTRKKMCVNRLVNLETLK